MFGTCRLCKVECDGVTRELDRNEMCADCAKPLPDLTAQQVAFFIEPQRLIAGYHYVYNWREIADLCEIPSEQRASFEQVIRTAEANGILEKSGTRVYVDPVTQTKRQVRAYSHASVSRFIVKYKPELAARIVATLITDPRMPRLCIGAEWLAAFASAAHRARAPQPVEKTQSVEIAPANVRYFEQVCAAEFDGATGPVERSALIGRLLMYRDMLATIRDRITKAGIFDYGPRQRKETTRRADATITAA